MSSVGGLPAFRIEELLDYIEFLKNREEKAEKNNLTFSLKLFGVRMIRK
jgi:hypothetical protein